jgi:hypothetical protein
MTEGKGLEKVRVLWRFEKKTLVETTNPRWQDLAERGRLVARL